MIFGRRPPAPLAATPPLSAPCPQCSSPFSLLATNEAGIVAMVLGLGDAPLGPMRTCCGCGTRYFVTTDGAHKFGEKLQPREPVVRESRPNGNTNAPRYPTPDPDMAPGFANREP